MTFSRSPPGQSAALREPDAAPEAARGAACLSTDDILELLLGVLQESKRDAVLEHIGTCEDCRVLFRSAAQAIEDTRPVSSSPRSGVFSSGTLVANRYRVERFLASGGMGEVYAVQDGVLNERVALKTVRGHPSDDVDAKAIARLKSEAQLSRRIGHPNTCRIFEFGEHETAAGQSVYFLTMELVEGETLGARLRRDGPLPLEHIDVVTRQVLGGLAEAHGLGIVHRDLKSDNVMLREPPTGSQSIDAVIMDFGLALRVDAAERLTSDSHALVGSAAYMAPEQVEGNKLTASADVYAFGVILFEMLTGQLPFRAATPVSTALKRLHHDPPVPSSLREALDPRWDTLVRSCLERDVQRRFASAREVLASLDQASVRVAGGASRRRSRALVVGLVLLTLLGGVALAWRGGREARRGAPAVRTADLPASALPAPAPRLQATENTPVAGLEATPSPPSPGSAPPPAGSPPPSSPAPPPPGVAPAPTTSGATRPSRAPASVPKSRRKTSVPRSPPPAPSAPTLPQAAQAEPLPPAAPKSDPAALRAPAGATPPRVGSPLDPLPLDPQFPE